MESTKEMKEVLFIKTSPHNYNDVKSIAVVLDTHPSIITWSIDLDDCDKIIRIECNGLIVDEIIKALHQAGIWSEEL